MREYFAHKANEATMLDDRDRAILDYLQANSDVAVAELAERVNLSLSACARRIKRLEDEGYIQSRVALLNRAKMRVGTTVFVALRNSRHSSDWHEPFVRLLADIPEIQEAHRLTGDIDYILKIAVPDVETYDVIYKRLVKKLEFSGISAYISMETLKATTAVPVGYAG